MLYFKTIFLSLTFSSIIFIVMFIDNNINSLYLSDGISYFLLILGLLIIHKRAINRTIQSEVIYSIIYSTMCGYWYDLLHPLSEVTSVYSFFVRVLSYNALSSFALFAIVVINFKWIGITHN